MTAKESHTTTPPPPPEKLSGGLPDAPEVLQSEEDVLDEALAESFPASDPVSPGIAERDKGN